MTMRFVLLVLIPAALGAQHQHEHPRPDRDSSRLIGAVDESMSGGLSADAMKHLELTPSRPATAEDSAKARAVVARLRQALAKYADTAVAVADGYQLFAPQLKQQRVFHFTNYRHAFMEAFRFDPEKPTSILYRRGKDGKLELLGAMYTAPKTMRARRLDGRIPLSIGQWHKHVNWCVPQKGDDRRWLERVDGKPVFGPESPIANRAACDDVGGRFHASLFGWMIHANVFAGESLSDVFAHEH